jgi:non-heme chloroperoxidase
MPRVQAGEVQLGWREWGEGEITVVFIHGNLASKDWIELAAPLFPKGIRTVGIDWRGCGDSDRVPALPNFSNYSMKQHADDMLAALDALDIERCHLATHSTGGIIAAHMLLMQPGRFGKVLALDPITPIGMPFDKAQIDVFRAMQADPAVLRSVMATAASSLFADETLSTAVPIFRDTYKVSQAFFDRLIAQTKDVSEGVWVGTPFNLNLEYERRELEARMREIRHEHLVIWGEKDPWIPIDHLEMIAATMPNCRLVTVPNVGHSMNIESPALYAGYFGAFFGRQPVRAPI